MTARTNALEKFVSSKYTYLLIAFALFFILEPLFVEWQERHPAWSIFSVLAFFLMAACFGCGVLDMRKKASLAVVATAVTGFIFENTGRVGAAAGFGWMTTASFAIYSIFVLCVIYGFSQRILAEKNVNFDAVAGGVFIYGLIGVLWFFLYSMLLYLQPEPFNKAAEGSLFYFSYITLTTIGYGDIYPISQQARVLAAMEGMSGQIFLAVFLARLVGLYIAEGALKRSK
jgi:hypothetical protein